MGKSLRACTAFGVLRCDDKEWVRQAVSFSVHRDLLFLHDLKQRRLGFARSTVDFVC